MHIADLLTLGLKIILVLLITILSVCPGMGDDPMRGASGVIPGKVGEIPKGMPTSGGGFDPSSFLGGGDPKSGGKIPGFDLGKALNPQGQPLKVPKSQKVSQNKAPPPKLDQVVKAPPQDAPGGGNEAPSSGSQNALLKEPPPISDVRKLPWQEKEKACILVSGPPNNTLIAPKSKQRISWNQSPCQMSARVVGMFQVMLYNSLKAVSDAKKSDLTKRDYSPNGKLSYDWGPIIPNLYDDRITNASDFYVRVETISQSGIFGSTPPLGGTYGPIAIVLQGNSDDDADNTSRGQQVNPMVSLPSAVRFVQIQSLVGPILIALVHHFCPI
ncbi:15329_t:CDS:2 [Funneliformis mosseae]|uniref:15329_t:CDS:1 n=1 Tax=Funneliformis mosseae TaxID=27381 RepID=A0A9N9HV67_FUNMO|nr:15329_t:CDS:2 [Funneliformis mosseae]